jgi:hypothetical protein
MRKTNLTETKMLNSLRSGQHATVYEVRRDPELNNKDIIRDRTKPVFPFVAGSQYKGQWNNDVKEGFGIQVNPDNTKYEGEWMSNRPHGRGTLWLKKGKSYQRQYVGDWANGKMEGQGIFYYENGEIYRGGWINGKKAGNGRQEYVNGDVYIGDWNNDAQNGFGTMNFVNGNIFEGLWSAGKKEGPGVFFYASTKKVRTSFFLCYIIKSCLSFVSSFCRSIKVNGQLISQSVVNIVLQHIRKNYDLFILFQKAFI